MESSGRDGPTAAGGHTESPQRWGEAGRPSVWTFAWPTLGGKQFWTDFRWWHGLRLQQHQLTNHWRVLSPTDRRLAWGSASDCVEEFHRQQDQLGDPWSQLPRPLPVVVLLHGLMRSSASLRGLAQYLVRHGCGSVVDFRYASARASLQRHAAALTSVVKHLPGRPRVSFVGHSMGNIVVRHAIADWQASPGGASLLARLQRVVMLAPPNQGAAIARALAVTGLFQILTGRPGTELGRQWQATHARLATPPCPFAVIAGQARLSAWNPLVENPNDLIVSVAETELLGAAEHLVFDGIHSFLMDDPRVQAATAEFLQVTNPAGRDPHD